MLTRILYIILFLCVSQSVMAFEEEIKVIEGLVEEGFPNLARIALNRASSHFPAGAPVEFELRIRILIAEKEFEKAQKSILERGTALAANPMDEKRLWFFLAETAHTARNVAVAETAYQNYFKTLTTADESTGQAAFHYGELMKWRGEVRRAKKIYEQTLTLTNSRPVQTKLAALLQEEDPERAKKLCEEVQLGGIDLWFGQTVVTWAHIMIRKEEWSEAQSVLETRLELLRTLSETGDPSGAPIAGARYLLGVCYEHENRNAEALTQFYNVYAKQGDSEWGPLAQEKVQALITGFETQGKTVKIDLGENKTKIEEGAIRVARRLFFNRQYAEAISGYLAALNTYPEGSESITALRELAVSAIKLDDEMFAKTVGLYLRERFANHPEAGDALLAAGKAALDQKRETLAWWFYEQAIDGFKNHPRMPGVLYTLAELRKQERYLVRIIETYRDGAYYARALGRLAWNSYEAEEYKTAAERFTPYIESEAELEKQIRARFALAESVRFLKQWNLALEKYEEVEKSCIDDLKDSYREKAVYYQAVCQKEIGKPEEAIQLCGRFNELFPESSMSEQVKFTKADALVECKRFVEALDLLRTFGDRADDPWAESALTLRGVAQFETGAYTNAITTMQTVGLNWPDSSSFLDAQFVLGRAYTAVGSREEAIRVFSDILNSTSDDLMIHRTSLELGRAQIDPTEKLASFQRVALLADPENKENTPFIAEALFESLPLYIELARYDDLLADSNRLLTTFPDFEKRDHIKRLQSQAEQLKVKLKI